MTWSQQITALVMLLLCCLLLRLLQALRSLLLCWRLVIASCRHFARCGCEVVCVLPEPGIVTCHSLPCLDGLGCTHTSTAKIRRR